MNTTQPTLTSLRDGFYTFTLRKMTRYAGDAIDSGWSVPVWVMTDDDGSNILVTMYKKMPKAAMNRTINAHISNHVSTTGKTHSWVSFVNIIK